MPSLTAPWQTSQKAKPECPTDQVVEGHLIPAHTTVRFPTFVIQRDPGMLHRIGLPLSNQATAANFSPDPKTFRPERWVEPEKEVRNFTFESVCD
jgi:hypothetical protein